MIEPAVAIDAVLILIATALAIPCWVVFVECLAAAMPGHEPRPISRKDAPHPRFAVLVPAHDEEIGILQTAESLVAELGPRDRLIVVADNCTDRTAEIARAAGAEVIERKDPERRGKGFAIVFGTEHLAADPPEVVILVDADCRVSEGALATLAARAIEADRPVQADYLLAHTNSKPGAVVSALALLVRNRVRPFGLTRLGMPSHLTGSGMALPWEVMRLAPPTGSALVEDMVIGIELALRGHPPLYCPEVRVTSVLPDQQQAAMRQRRRWEHGQLSTLFQLAPSLIGRGLLRLRLPLVAMGLDLVVPPLALLVLLLSAGLAFTAGAGVLGASWLPLGIVASGIVLLGVAIAAAWILFGRSTIPFRYVAAIPLYVLWKVPLYVSYFVRGRQQTWERTDRTVR